MHKNTLFDEILLSLVYVVEIRFCRGIKMKLCIIKEIFIPLAEYFLRNVVLDMKLIEWKSINNSFIKIVLKILFHDARSRLHRKNIQYLKSRF